MAVLVLDQVHRQDIATPTTALVSNFLVFLNYVLTANIFESGPMPTP